MTSTPSVRDKYRSFTHGLEPLAGFVVAYLVIGFVQSLLINGATETAMRYTLSNLTYVALWPIGLADPVYWTFTAVGVLAAVGVLGGLERSRLPISAPRRVPTLEVKHGVVAVVTFVLAEAVARFTTAAAFVVHLHLFEPYRGEPGTSVTATVTLYQDVLAFFTDYVAHYYLFWFGQYLPEISSVRSGGPEINHALRQIGEIQFFDGIGFAIIFGYPIALGLSYIGVRKASAWMWPRLERYRAAE